MRKLEMNTYTIVYLAELFYSCAMIEIRIRQMAERRGLSNAYQLRKALENLSGDPISPTLTSRLWKGDFANIGIKTLDRLCQVLKCQPDKLFKFMPDEKERRS